jgi:thiamine-phosphate pyrophosphorylase
MYDKLQYISQGDTIEEQLYNIHQALDYGCNWIQMRFKNHFLDEAFTLAEAVQILCEKYQATFIINDNVYLAQQIVSNGVHLGLSDMGIKQARLLLGNNKIIGATANTFDNIASHVANGCDYIGLGPYQFTTTKEKLSPILGLEGYRTIMKELNNQNIKIPIYAIGGISLQDVDELMQTGIHGIAVSGLITESRNKTALITKLNDTLYGNIII